MPIYCREKYIDMGFLDVIYYVAILVLCMCSYPSLFIKGPHYIGQCTFVYSLMKRYSLALCLLCTRTPEVTEKDFIGFFAALCSFDFIIHLSGL